MVLYSPISSSYIQLHLVSPCLHSKKYDNQNTSIAVTQSMGTFQKSGRSSLVIDHNYSLFFLLNFVKLVDFAIIFMSFMGEECVVGRLGMGKYKTGCGSAFSVETFY